MTVTCEMINPGNRNVAATSEGVMVLFDIEERSAVAIPDKVRGEASKHIRAEFV